MSRAGDGAHPVPFPDIADVDEQRTIGHGLLDLGDAEIADPSFCLGDQFAGTKGETSTWGGHWDSKPYTRYRIPDIVGGEQQCVYSWPPLSDPVAAQYSEEVGGVVPVSVEEANDLVAMVGEFARERVAPRVAEYDAAEALPLDLLKEMAGLGLFGGAVAVEDGGLGLDYVTYARIIEEMSRTCHVMGVLMSMPTSLVGGGIASFGTQEQKEKYLRPLAAGEIFGAAGVTEPRSGSDVAGMETHYRREGDEFVINGAKAWISNIDIAEFFVTFATMDRSKGHRGITAFLIPKHTPGVSTQPYKNKLGFRPLASGDLVLDDVRVGQDALLGAEGEGFAVAMTAVERGRLSVAARAVGLAQACMDDAIAYAKTRETFGTTIDHYQIVQSKITDMAVGIKSARLLVLDAARELDQGLRARQATSMAKMHASDVAQRAATDSLQIHGAAGVSADFRIGRLYRDAKVFQIVEGSNDIHRALIAEMELGLRTKS